MNPWEINPLLIIGSSAVLYTVIVFLRRQAFYLVLLFIAVFNLSFIFLSSGQATLEVLQKQPQLLQRVECLGQSIFHGAPLKAKASVGISSCHFDGTGLSAGDNNKIQTLITPAES